MTAREIAAATKDDLLVRLRLLQKMFDALTDGDPIPIVREHLSVMRELKRRNVPELEIEWALHPNPCA